MKIFINAHNLRFGGGKTVGFNLINYYIANPAVSEIMIVAPAGYGYERFQGVDSRTSIYFLPAIFNTSVFKIISNYVVLPLRIALSRTDFVLSLGNVAVPTLKPQFLLIHQAYLAYPESIVWDRLRQSDRKFYRYIRNMLRLVKANLKYPTVYGVQTNTMRKRISSIYKIPKEDIHVIPNAVSFTSFKKGRAGSTAVKGHQQIRLLFLSKYFPHKNFEILFKVGLEIVSRGLPIRISVTIDEEENEGSKRFIETIKAMGLHEVIINKGNVRLEEIAAAYDEHDGLFLPTLLESFSGSYIEAMYFSRPIFTSDMDFAREVCRDAAYYFNPLDEEDIIYCITAAYDNRTEMARKVEAGSRIVAQSYSWEDIGRFIDTNVLKLK
ncbi:glycosyltransferase [Chitinophaga agri]|uniref:Glycosyltransferase family 4 protein n=1 Tax=Chitinophaga agri TaxID=2703787 RepID=A0A6B9Z7P3_9BACT|nr:glycosyltransferase [Chitinophaga agri]QHS58240.1 glycosyltransferase family 4 protein [Chitinophaga agri]